MNSKAMGKLASACRTNVMARAICDKYMPGSAVSLENSEGEEIEVIRLDGDAHHCWIELKSTAMGGIGVATAENTVSQLMQIDPSSMDAMECMSRTETLYRRLKGLKTFTIDMLMKFILLKNISCYPEMEVVEEKCSTDESMDFDATANACRLTAQRKNNSNASTATAAFAGACWTCNQRGHTAERCPNNQDKGGKGGKGGKGKPYNGKSKQAKRNRKFRQA